MTKGFVDYWLSWIGRLFGAKKAPAQSLGAVEAPMVYRVVEPGKPRFQLRQGEEGLSVFDARHVKPEDILPAFRPGSSVAAVYVEWLESVGLQVVKTPGDSRLPQLLQDNHAIICAGDGMTRNQFKQILKGLAAPRGGKHEQAR